MNDLIKRLFATIDRKDADGFVAFLTQDASFRFANAPVIRNKENIRNAVAQFLSNIKSLSHRILGVWEQGNIIICEGEVTYIRHDGASLTLPFVDILRMSGDMISDYRIYMDISALNS